MRSLWIIGDQIFKTTQNQFQIYNGLVVDLCPWRLCILASADHDSVGHLAETFTGRVVGCDFGGGDRAAVFAINSEYFRKSASSRFAGPRDRVVA